MIQRSRNIGRFLGVPQIPEKQPTIESGSGSEIDIKYKSLEGYTFSIILRIDQSNLFIL